MQLLASMDETENIQKKIDKNILDLLWKLTNNKPQSRIDACADILRILITTQNETVSGEVCTDLHYCTERLVKGLASPRDCARLGFSLLLTEILKHIAVVEVEVVLELLQKHLSISSKQEKRDVIFGQLFTYSAIVRSGRLVNHSHLSFVVISLFDLWQDKSYTLNASYTILLDLFTQISAEQFQEHIWPHLKKRLSFGWGKSSADSLWPLLLCARMFPDAVTTKYLQKHWGASDIFAPENFDQHKKHLRQTTACLPVLHPLCLEILALSKSRKHMKDIWNAVVDENLFEADQTEKAFVGFEMIKKLFQETEKKKVIKYALSPKFCSMFTKSFLNSKHPMNPAATLLTSFFAEFVNQSNDPEVQFIVLKVFLQPSGTIWDQLFKKKEVSAIIQNLLPDAVKSCCDFLKSICTDKKINSGEDETNTFKDKRFQAVYQIGTLVAHPAMMNDVEWRLSVIKFLFLHSFFDINAASTDILHCEVGPCDVPDTLREAFRNAFYKAVNSLNRRTDNHGAPLELLLQHLILFTEYADELMTATEVVTPHFELEKIQEPWLQMKSIVHKLSKQTKKDGNIGESNAFQALFLELGLHLFWDPDRISEVLEELHICCKNALHARKHPEKPASSEDEPSWICVVTDILLSLLSRSSNHLRGIVTSVFHLLCPFITEEALQQILSVVSPEKADDDPMLVDEDDKDSELEFGSGSSDESDSNEPETSKVDEQFRKKVKAALGPAAEESDAESVVLTDSEMFDLDGALAEVFQSRVQTGHTQLSFGDKTMLNFRVRCLDLVMSFLKSDPPMHLVLCCIDPVLAAFEYGHRSKQQSPLLIKTVSTLKCLVKIKKFQNLENVDKAVLKGILENLMAKCHKETDMTVALILYSLCVFLVLCFKRLEGQKSPGKKSKKLPVYMKMYISALEMFVKQSNSNMFPQFFVSLMQSCEDLSWHFIGPCKEYAFDMDVRIYKRTQCLGLIFEALKFSKSQTSIDTDQWTEVGSFLIPTAVKTLKVALNNSEIKPVYLTELLDVIHTTNSILKEKTSQSLLLKHKELLDMLVNMEKSQKKKLMKKGNGLRRKLILELGGTIAQTLKKAKPEVPVPEEEEEETVTSEDSLQEVTKKSVKKKSKSAGLVVTEEMDNEENLLPENDKKSVKRKLTSKDKKKKKKKAELGTDDS